MSYSITDGDSASVFWINTTNGELYVSGFLDREATDSYTLTVTASDGGILTPKHIFTIVYYIVCFL